MWRTNSYYEYDGRYHQIIVPVSLWDLLKNRQGIVMQMIAERHILKNKTFD